MAVVSITLPSDLLKKFDDFIATRGYFSRSEGFRDALRNLMEEAEFAKIESSQVFTTIITTYDYERRDADFKMTEIKHEFDDVIVENVHRHVNGRYCLEIFIAHGNSERIRDLIGRIRGMRGIQQVKAMFVSL